MKMSGGITFNDDVAVTVYLNDDGDAVALITDQDGEKLYEEE